MKKKRKLKKLPIIIIIAILLIIIGTIVAIKYTQKINSNEYKLGELGYNEKDISTITKLKQEEIDIILNKDYKSVIPKLIKEKYFLFKNLDSYLEYFNENNDEDLDYIIAIVNVKSNYDHYDEDIVISSDTEKQNLLLVNKYTKLNSDYVPENLTNIPLTLSFEGNQTTKEVLSAFKSMWTAAKKEGLTLIVNSSYRDYQSQEEVWNNYENAYGEEYADSIAARPGFSEHQTGLALDIITYGANKNTFDTTDEFKWLEKNAHKYGFILRYPKDKEDITGYAYESWHYRYVGKTAASEIKNLNITFDEYYAFYKD